MIMKNKLMAVTVDVEDWFQVENLRSAFPQNLWNGVEMRLEANLKRLLNLFDNLNIKATFFVLGWVAERVPNILKEISLRGHEIGSHGFWHRLCNTMTSQEIKDELARTKGYFEDKIGKEVSGFRAPNFSVTRELLISLKETGYTYDSSYNSFSLNPRYGSIDLQIKRDVDGILELDNGIYELPISNIKLNKFVFPAGGGAYFRIFPLSLFKMLVNYILKTRGWYLFYMHPWEIDPHQPKVSSLSKNHKFRHYFNLHKTFDRLEKLLRYFLDKDLVQFVSCSELIKIKYSSNENIVSFP